MTSGKAADDGSEAAGRGPHGHHHHADHDHHPGDGAHLHVVDKSSPTPRGGTMTVRTQAIGLGERLFLASALERIAMAAVLVVLIWLAVRWAAA